MNEKAISFTQSRPHGHTRVKPLAHTARHLFRRFVLRFVAPISRHPAMTLITGLGLFISGTVELFEQIFTDFDTIIGVHQGVILLGIVTFLRGLADVVEASEWLSKGTDEEEAVHAPSAGNGLEGLFSA